MADNDKSKTPWYGALWDFLMAHKSLQEAAGTAPAAAPRANEDNSMVAKAAKEAGDRVDAEKRRNKDLMSANRVKGPSN